MRRERIDGSGGEVNRGCARSGEGAPDREKPRVPPRRYLDGFEREANFGVRWGVGGRLRLEVAVLGL